MITIAIFDDHKERREALKLLISLDSGLACVGDYENCTHLVHQLQAAPPQVVLMDIDMPETDGIAGVRMLQEHFPDTYIIMQTVFEDDEKIFNSIRAGAHGYLLKKTPPQKLIDGIYDVVNGGSPMTSTVARRILQLFKQPQSASKEQFDLSEREVEVLTLLVKGFSQKMVSAELYISPFTVANHVKNIYHKLHVHNASEAVAIAIRKRLI